MENHKNRQQILRLLNLQQVLTSRINETIEEMLRDWDFDSEKLESSLKYKIEEILQKR